MKVLSLKLRGFKGIKAGMGVDEIAVDFSILPDGLIAITGENGGGKTTLLDSIHPYRLMPYKLRKSPGWSPSAFSYYDQCYGSDALKELVFSLGDEVYMSRILIDADRKKQEAYLYRSASGVCPQDGPFADWQPMNDGKSKTYDEAIEKLVGSPTLFFTSVFRSQGARNLSEYTRGDIMGILGELLNTDHIREQGQKCREAVAALSDDLAAVRARRVAIAGEVEKEQLVAADLSWARDSLASFRHDRDAEEKKAERIRKEISTLEAEAAGRAAAEQRLADLREAEKRAKADVVGCESEQAAALEKLQSGYDRRDRELAESLAVVRRDQLAIQSDLEIDVSKIHQQTEVLAKRIADGNALVANADTLRFDAIRCRDLQKHLPDIQEVIDHAELKLAEIAKADALRQDYENRIIAFERAFADGRKLMQMDAGTLRQKIATAESAVARLDGIDCRADGSGWANGSCRFIADAAASRGALPGLRDELSALEAAIALPDDDPLYLEAVAARAALPDTALDRERYEKEKRSATAEQRSVMAEIAVLGGAEAKLATVESVAANLDEWRDSLAKLAADKIAIKDRAASRLAVLEERQTALEDDRRSSREQFVTQKNAALVDHRIKVDELQQRVAVLSRQVAEAVVDLGPDPVGELQAVESQLAQCLSRCSILAEECEKAAATVGRHEALLATFQPLRLELAGLDDKESRINAEIVDLSILQKACSNDGIIALEMDDAAPSISAIVNELLSSCYGPRFAIRLDTQTARADGSMREAFDIVVFDAETDEEASITEKSGGQVTLLEDAIVRGICLFNIHRSDRSFHTLFSDEKDGALSEENKRAFLAVKRKALELGTHRQEFFISQTLELVDMADCRLVVNRGGVALQ